MKLRPFELALVVIFVVLMALSLVFISMYQGSGDDKDAIVIGTVNIWGTLSGEPLGVLLQEIRLNRKEYQDVVYTSIPEEEFDSRLVNALADGTGPDLVLISQERLVDLRRRIQPISYDSFSRRDIQTAYIDGAQIFALSDGLYGFPIAVDPLMLYWNRDILANDGLLSAPPTWESLVNVYFETLIRRSNDRSIQRAVVALGEYNNIRNSFGILSTLLLQSGSQGVTDEGSGRYTIRIDETQSGSGGPLSASADFYTRFSRVNNSLYSWNRSFTEDRASFLSENLALYFGYGSEGREIEQLNPNLNFDIAQVPQSDGATVRRTYGKFYALSIMKNANNVQGAAVVMQDLGGAELSLKIAQAYNLVPTLRSLVSAGSSDTYGQLNYQAAPIAYGWLNPRRSGTDTVFRTLLQDLNENRRLLTDSTSDAVRRLQLEYN
jgi:ABC-type glycerol-3-phosphate transport system substrate-binding protein